MYFTDVCITNVSTNLSSFFRSPQAMSLFEELFRRERCGGHYSLAHQLSKGMCCSHRIVTSSWSGLWGGDWGEIQFPAPSDCLVRSRGNYKAVDFSWGSRGKQKWTFADTITQVRSRYLYTLFWSLSFHLMKMIALQVEKKPGCFFKVFVALHSRWQIHLCILVVTKVCKGIRIFKLPNRKCLK